jgi:hypothetical protein
MSRRRRNGSPFSLFSFQDIVTSVTAVIILMTLLLALELIHRTLEAASRRLVSSAEIQEAIEEAQKHADELRERLRQSGDRLRQAAAFSPASLQRELRDVKSQRDTLSTELEQLRKEQTTAKKAEQDAMAQAFDREADRAELEKLRAKQKSLAQSVADQRQANDEKRGEIEEIKLDKTAKAKGRRIYNPAPGAGKQAWLVEVAGDRMAAAPLGKVARPVLFTGRTTERRVAAFSAWMQKRSAASDYFVMLIRPDGIASFDALRVAVDSRGFDMGFDLIGKDDVVLDPERGAGDP